MNASVHIKKQIVNDEHLQELTKDDLIAKIKSLTAHNEQLKRIIAKSSKTDHVSKKRQKPFDFDKYVYRRILLKFLYMGWNYHGYVVQEDTSNTVENYLFDALTKTCLIKDRTLSNYHRCGRTDKGVSSFGQVISIDVRSKLSTGNEHKIEDEIDYCSILNKVLPDDIQCVAWSPVTEDFSARFDCKRRTYKYFFPKGNLNIQKMASASTYLIGTHDFRNLCKMDVGNGVIKFVRNISSIDIAPFVSTNIDEYTMYVVTIKSQAFLWHQIRCIMGVLFLIGDQKEEPEVIVELLDVEKNPRKPEYSMASEVPLNLYYCEYEDESINWQMNSSVVGSVLEKLNRKWTFSVVQETMIRSMMGDLKDNIKYDITDNCLIEGTRAKVYTPLMKRQKCESLEEKIKHYVKRSRLEIKEDT